MSNSDIIDTALAEFINKTTDALSTATNFMVDQLPDVVSQLLMWKMVESLIGCLFWVVLIVGFTALAVYSSKYTMKKVECRDWDAVSYVGLILLAITLACLIGVSSEKLNLTWLQIWIAPKIYLIEYASSLVK